MIINLQTLSLLQVLFFLQFNFYVILLTLFNITLYTINVIIHFVLRKDGLDARLQYKSNIILLVTDMVLTVIFLLFSFSLFYNQITMIKDQTSKIDVLKETLEKQQAKSTLAKKLPF